MKINTLRLKNFRCFGDLEIDFNKQLTVLVGINGAGKTAVLEGITVGLTSLVSQFSPNAGYKWTKNDRKIKNNSVLEPYAKVYISAVDQDDSFEWDRRFIGDKIAFAKLDVPQKIGTKQLSEYIERLTNKEQYEQPVFAYYGCNRAVLKRENLKTQKKIPAERKDAFRDCFTPASAFSDLLAWFERQEAYELRVRRDNSEYIDPALIAVRLALATALEGFSNPRIEGNPPEFVITKAVHENMEYTVKVNQISDGYRSMLGLVMDLARRMALANKDYFPLEHCADSKYHLTNAIVLIDEVELHLHPSWQQRVLPDLMRIFPNTQFIVTTHSPQVVSSVPHEHIRVLENGKIYDVTDVTEGVDAGRILDEVFGVDPLPLQNAWAKRLKECHNLVFGEKWDDPRTKELLKTLKEHYGHDYPPIYEMELHLENLAWEREHENRV